MSDPLARIEQHLGTQDSKLNDTNAKLDRVLTYLEGDDLDPEKPGIKVRLDRIEQFIATEKKIIWAIIGVVVSSVVGFFIALFKGGVK